MTRELIGFVLVTVVFAIAVLVGIGYRRKRVQETQSIAPFREAENCSGIECLYVSTVLYENPLQRLLAHGLGPRGKATIAADAAGVSVCRRGETNFFVPRENLMGMHRASATIDRGVEPGGLTSFAWSHDGQSLITNLRFNNSQDRELFERQVLS